MLLAKILAISVGVSSVFMAKAVVAPSVPAGAPAYFVQQAQAVDTVEPQAIMRAASRDLPAESWTAH